LSRMIIGKGLRATGAESAQVPYNTFKVLLRRVSMTVLVTYPHIVKAEGFPARLARLPRIRVSQIVVDYLNHGWSADEICIHYTHLKPAEVHSAMAYYFDHQAEIEREIEAEQLQIAESRRSAETTGVELRLKEQGLLPH
jgi:hypothetical protein